MKTGILFDLDGTLLDTLDDIYDAVNAALADFGYPARTKAEVRRFTGNGAGRLLMLSVPEGEDSAPVCERFKHLYTTRYNGKTCPYAGIPEALAELGKKYPLAIVSNKPDSAVGPLCALNFPGLYARGESAECPRKPAPDMVYAAMKSIGVDRCIYVGDSEVDILTARNSGVPCISVLWGFRDREDMEKEGAVYFCEEPSELPRVVEQVMAECIKEG